MSKVEHTLHEIHSMDLMAAEDGWLTRIHPLVKLVVTVSYIIVVVSYDKYQVSGVLGMSVYPIILFIVGEISVKDSVRRLRVVLPLVCFVGLLNPFFDRETIMQLGQIPISGGVISMVTLIIKGVLTVFATYLLIATTTIEKICYALRLLHLPKLFVTQILLIYRYVTVLLSQANRMIQAYQLRAPKQKGIAVQAWGSLVGQLLLRSMDLAETVYDSMCLRGYEGEFYYGDGERTRRLDYIYMVGFIVLFLIVRWVPILDMIGNVFI